MAFNLESSLMQKCGLLIACFVWNTYSEVIFDSVDPKLFDFGRVKSCSAVTLETLALDTSSCALACDLNPSCLAFVRTSTCCSLYSAPCSETTLKASRRLMVRRQEHPATLTWYFDGSTYILTQTSGGFDDMQEACSLHGMYISNINTDAELAFTEKKILSNVTKNYTHDTWGYLSYKIWVGARDINDKICLLTDLATTCPITKYGKLEPNGLKEECIHWWKRNDEFSWNDYSCNETYYAICERTQM